MRQPYHFAFLLLFVLLVACLGNDGAQTSEQATSGIKVTAENFRRAETHRYFTRMVQVGALGKLDHQRELVPVEDQEVVRTNRDTYYSMGVFDLDAGPVTISLPDAGDRYMSLLALDEDHYVVGMYHAPEQASFSRADVGTRYLGVIVRTFGDPDDAADLAKVYELQDAIAVELAAGEGSLDLPDWDQMSLARVRDSLSAISAGMYEYTGAFGSREAVDDRKHLQATATGWGGNPPSEAVYESVSPEMNDGKTPHRLHVDEVPVDGFWSVTVYDKDGFMQPNEWNAYSLNSITASPNTDGSFDIQFGDCDGQVPNCLPITRGWNYTVRMYLPRPEVLNGKWKFPKAEPLR